VLLPTMATCPFCNPSAVKAEEATQAAQYAATPEAFGTPPGFQVTPGVACLEIVEGPNRGQRVDLGTGSITVGRAPDNVVVIKDPSVSSHHARIDFYQGKYFLSDLKSSNGTYVNNTRIEQVPLNHKDLVVMGSSRFIVNLGLG
jgi:pSer/pThr/pTyr-binding forkhead associated (FHA) protein